MERISNKLKSNLENAKSKINQDQIKYNLGSTNQSLFFKLEMDKIIKDNLTILFNLKYNNPPYNVQEMIDEWSEFNNSICTIQKYDWLDDYENTFKSSQSNKKVDIITKISNYLFK